MVFSSYSFYADNNQPMLMCIDKEKMLLLLSQAVFNSLMTEGFLLSAFLYLYVI